MIAENTCRLHVAVLVFPFAAPSVPNFARKLACVMASVTVRTILIGGGITSDIALPPNVQVHDIGVRMHYLKEKQPRWLSALLWIAKAVLAQIRFSQKVVQLRHEIDVVVCSLGCYYQLPVLLARLLGKKVVCASTGIDSRGTRVNYGSLLGTLTSLLTRFNFALSQAILVESLRLGTCKELTPFQFKLCNGALFLEDQDHFQSHTSIRDRENLVGYVGRLTAEKGVMEFVQAIPIALKQRPDLHFMIIGTGTLDGTLEMALHAESWASHVTWLRWVAHERIPDYLNQLKLTVIPSYTEGLPNLALEAMGCGTPVLATGVGGIPDLVNDGKTGFLLTDNTPDTIAQAIVRIVDDPRLEAVALQARALVERHHSLDAASKRYQAILRALIEEREK